MLPNIWWYVVTPLLLHVCASRFTVSTVHVDKDKLVSCWTVLSPGNLWPRSVHSGVIAIRACIDTCEEFNAQYFDKPYEFSLLLQVSLLSLVTCNSPWTPQSSLATTSMTWHMRHCREAALRSSSQLAFYQGHWGPSKPQRKLMFWC